MIFFNFSTESLKYLEYPLKLCVLSVLVLLCVCMSMCVAENRKLLHEQNVEKVLVDLLSVANVSVKAATCQAVSAMSFHLASKDIFRDLGTYTFTQAQ